MVSLNSLNKVRVLKALDRYQLAEVQEIAEELTFKGADRLFQEGEDAKHLWVVIEGQVDLRFDMPGRATSPESTVTRTKAQKTEARTLGWSCFVPPHKMRLSAYCISDECKVIRIEKEGLVRLFEKDPKIGYLVMSYMVEVVGFRFQQFQDEMAKHLGEDMMHGW